MDNRRAHYIRKAQNCSNYGLNEFKHKKYDAIMMWSLGAFLLIAASWVFFTDKNFKSITEWAFYLGIVGMSILFYIGGQVFYNDGKNIYKTSLISRQRFYDRANQIEKWEE